MLQNVHIRPVVTGTRKFTLYRVYGDKKYKFTLHKLIKYYLTDTVQQEKSDSLHIYIYNALFLPAYVRILSTKR